MLDLLLNASAEFIFAVSASVVGGVIAYYFMKKAEEYKGD